MALRVARVLTALLGFSAVVTEVATLVERGTLVPANFLSFFTVQSNLLAAGVLLVAAYAGPGRSRAAGSRRLDAWRGAVTVYMVLVLVVFAVLLSGLDAELTAVPWDNTVLHRIVPVLVVLDWLVAPPRHRIPRSASLLWLLYPLAYLGYTLVRGASVGWYPYPFTDPAHGGYGQVALTSVAIAAGVLVVTWLVTLRHARR